MNRPHPLDYETPRAEGKTPRYNGWWIVLVVLPALLFWLSQVPHAHSLLLRFEDQAVFNSVFFAYLGIGLRAVEGLIRRERNRTWIVYVILACLMPFLAGGIADIWR